MSNSKQLSRTYVIRHGRVIDPLYGIDRIADVVVEDGIIAAIGDGGLPEPGRDVIDATGKLVVPGLIDLHAHVYKGVSCYGLDPDRAGVLSGVTHVNDMGSTGWLTFVGFRMLVAQAAQSRISCFPNVLPLGVPENWCIAMPDLASVELRPELLLALAEEHDDLIRGVKVYIERGVMSQLGDQGWRNYRAAREVADALGMHVYVHLGDLFPKRADAITEPPERVPIAVVERMQPGDILGHCFTQHPGGLVDAAGRVSPAARLATDKGIKHEIGHGLNFSFERARRLLDAGIMPHIISSDIHGTRMHAGRLLPVFGLEADIDAPYLTWSMIGTMSKVLALGVSLMDVIRMATLEPARALRMDDRKGSLSVGFPAEITLLDHIDGPVRFFDSIGAEATGTTLLLPAQTFIENRTWRCRPFELPEFRNEYLGPNPGLATSLAMSAV